MTTETTEPQTLPSVQHHAISGRITDDKSLPVTEVRLHLAGNEGSLFTDTDQTGNYTFESVPAQTEYELTPTKPAFSFDPDAFTIKPNAADVQQDFKATIKKYELTGIVSDSQGVPLSGVTLTLAAKETKTRQTDAVGRYKFDNVTGANSYTITPDKAGFTFTPPSLPIVYLRDSLTHSFFGSSLADRDRPPSQWTVLNDYSKTIITLASGLLVLSVTFSSQLLSKNSDWISNSTLTATWIALSLTIVAGVLTNVFVIQYLRNNVHGRRAVFWANGSYAFLALAGLTFLAFGFYAIWFTNKKWDIGETIDQATKSLPGFVGTNAKWNLQSMQWNKNANTYELLFVKEGTDERTELEVDPVTNRISKILKKSESNQGQNANAHLSVNTNTNSNVKPTLVVNSASRTKRHRKSRRRNRRFR
ncbi:MAG: hypothetical protein QOH41_767 [Blastocatellia bacterium]|jgi:hypothetical protein|nr:hypothetical protein [Blastocatellia bacterium]